MSEVSSEVRKFLKEIGSLGGKKSRRKLTPEQAREMQAKAAIKRKNNNAVRSS